MREQLAHLVIMSEMDNVTIQIVPSSCGIHLGLVGSFSLLEFTDASVAYVEHIAGSIQLERESEIRACKVAFEQLRSIALTPEESVALIDRMASDR